VRESNSIVLTIPTAEAMRELGTKLGTALHAVHTPAQCVAIEGELGAGKTTLVAGVLAAAGVRGAVRSPTYTLIEPYEVAGRSIYHLDLYRLTDPSELEPLGVRDLLTGESILLIEWPSRAGARLPPVDVGIAIAYDDSRGGREVRLEAGSVAGTEVLGLLLR
jgi:tRNA threonylcarbamoyladenosine biosynthesis protein TsaE